MSALGTPGSPKLHTVRLTAATVINLPIQNLKLIRVRTLGGATPGTFSLLYDGISTAHFIAATNGNLSWRVTWPIGGLTIAAAIQTFSGGISAAVLTFSTGDEASPPIAQYRAIRFARTDGVATTANITVNFDRAPANPRRAIASTSTSTGRFTFPTDGPTTQTVECDNRNSLEGFEAPSDPLYPNLSTIEPLNQYTPSQAGTLPFPISLTLSGISDAAQTIQCVVYYDA